MRRAAKIDNTARELVKHAKALGADYLPLNDVLDGVLLFRGRIALVDWKSPGGTLTDAQARLSARGWPVAYVSTTEQLERLLGVETR